MRWEINSLLLRSVLRGGHALTQKAEEKPEFEVTNSYSCQSLWIFCFDTNTKRLESKNIQKRYSKCRKIQIQNIDPVTWMRQNHRAKKKTIGYIYQVIEYLQYPNNYWITIDSNQRRMKHIFLSLDDVIVSVMVQIHLLYADI